MTISEIAHLLNHVAEKKKYDFRFIQYYRAQKYKRRPQTYSPFSSKTIFVNEHYAYHSGGRHEIQFNVGRERSDHGETFRYGLAFSLEQGRSLIYPVDQFGSKISLFNQFVMTYPDYFRNMLMWYYDADGVKHTFRHVMEIPETIIKINHFIFMGKVINKPIAQINHTDIDTILVFFDYLLKLYQFVEPIVNDGNAEDRIARLCWNTYGWIKPSGREGKSGNESHEHQYGYGHEEWLLDLDKTIDGYHYGFLEPVNKFISKYVGYRYNIILYTIDSRDKQKYWVGKINNLEVIDTITSSQATQLYLENGWIEEMKSQLEAVRLDGDSLDSWINEGKLFNIRFKANDLGKVYSSPIPISSNDPRITSTRYNLLEINSNADLPDVDIDNEFNINTGNDGDHLYSNSKIKKSFHVDIEFEQKHYEMSDKFLRYLKTEYPADVVKRECHSFRARRIDIVRQTSEGNIFYEIKTYNDPLTSLRNALGQIFEYAFYPNHKKAIKLVIVSHRPADYNLRIYIKHLNTIVNIPIEYICFDLERCIIVN